MAEDDKKIPLVVKLSLEDRSRLDYACEKTGLTKAVLVRMLIRAASEGQLHTDTLKMTYTPYSETQKSPK